MLKNIHGLGKHSLVLILVGLVALTITACAPKAERSSHKFNITLSEDAFYGIDNLGLEVPVKGRVFAIISKDKDREPRLSTGVTGVPLWGMDVTDWEGGEKVIIEDGKETVRGYPFDNTWEFPSGDYVVQAFLNVYTTFHRADGHTVEMHLNSGAHQNLFRAPGNAFSDVIPLTVEAGKGGTVDLSAILDRTWDEIGRDLEEKLHFAVGTMDNYYLNEAVYLIQDVLESKTAQLSGKINCWNAFQIE